TGGTASPGADYTPTNGTLVFGDGELSKSFSVRILDDTIPENSETVILTLSNPSGGAAIVVTNTVPLTILDDDVGFSFSTPAYIVNEGDGEALVDQNNQPVEKHSRPNPRLQPYPRAINSGPDRQELPTASTDSTPAERTGRVSRQERSSQRAEQSRERVERPQRSERVIREIRKESSDD
ncbi:MAG: Calx-beta domain-containing protein, partial [Arenimonas sp.]